MTPGLVSHNDDVAFIVQSTLAYLTKQWPSELAGVSATIAGMPSTPASGKTVPRWSIDKNNRTIVLYRYPMERFAKLHINDAWHRRVAIESTVFAAVAELLGTDPWGLAPGRFPPL